MIKVNNSGENFESLTFFVGEIQSTLRCLSKPDLYFEETPFFHFFRFEETLPDPEKSRRGKVKT